MRRFSLILTHITPTLALALAMPIAAQAQEVFLGGAFGGVDTPFSLDVGERGGVIQGGYRAAPIGALNGVGSPSPYILASVNVDGKTSFIAAGLSWKFGDKVYIRPGIALALNDNGKARFAPSGDRLDLGSTLLFEPEIVLGAKLLPDLSIEAAWTHISHAQFFGGQNPGLDVIGIRMVKHLR